MRRPCEICTVSPRDNAQLASDRYVLVERRVVALCGNHAAQLKKAKVQTLKQLVDLFAEANGKRSLFSRRAPLDRRVFPPRPEGRRRSDGRRTNDSSR